MTGLRNGERLVGLYATGDSIASVTAGKMLDNSRFNKRPILGPISKVEKWARQDDDIFAVVFVRLDYCVALGIRREKEQERTLASCVLVVVYYGSNPVREQACGHVGR